MIFLMPSHACLPRSQDVKHASISAEKQRRRPFELTFTLLWQFQLTFSVFIEEQQRPLCHAPCRCTLRPFMHTTHEPVISQNPHLSSLAQFIVRWRFRSEKLWEFILSCCSTFRRGSRSARRPAERAEPAHFIFLPQQARFFPPNEDGSKQARFSLVKCSHFYACNALCRTTMRLV